MNFGPNAQKKSMQKSENIINELSRIGREIAKLYIKMLIMLFKTCDPVEFLLVLYQIINPHRTSYTLNDRLLLSSVVHLTIKSTLKELHVRIPSPPKPAKKRKTPKQKKRKEYVSPYLESLTYNPTPPKCVGMSTNKPKQYPESPYFAYIPELELQKLSPDLVFPTDQKDLDFQKYMKEFHDAEEFYRRLIKTGKCTDFHLVPPKIHKLCPNILHPPEPSPIDPRFITPHLCKVTVSEELLCFCNENPPQVKKLKKSCCEKNAQKYLESLCFCEECMEQLRQKNLIRIHEGYQGRMCKCEDPVPIIAGTISAKICDCYKDYRDKIVGCAARQRLKDEPLTHLIGNVVMTKLGPVYTILGTKGSKICLCNEILVRKQQIKKIKNILSTNEAKFVIGGVSYTSNGPVYNLTSVVARKPCKCILSYREKLKALIVQNQLRSCSITFVNYGLICGKFGPIFHISNVADGYFKNLNEVREVCSCEIKKAQCFERCRDYVEYRANSHKSNSGCSASCTSETSSLGDSTSSSTSSNFTENNECCRFCDSSKKKKSCKIMNRETISSTSTSSTEDSSSMSSGKCPFCTKHETTPMKSFCKKLSTRSFSPTSSENYEKSCSCKDELDKFLISKCPCEECNRKIRQSYARYVMGGTKTTASGKQINIVQGIHQPLCSCLQDHLKNVEKIDDYRARVKARYEMRKKPKKYCISGVCYTPLGPKYVISSVRPPVECECGKALREKKEMEEYEKQRAKLPNTGRIKYEITGVKAMPEKNVYILSAVRPTAPCKCENLLSKFENAHRTCMTEFEQYLRQAKEEMKLFENDKLEDKKSETNLIINSDLHLENEGEYAIPNEINQKISNEVETPFTEAQVEELHIVPELSSNGEVNNAVESTSELSSNSEDSECGSCHVDNPAQVIAIIIPQDKPLPEVFVNKRFAIFKTLANNQRIMMETLKHILKGMAEDGFPLAKLPQVYKLPIFKLWINMRCKMFWTHTDKVKSYVKSTIFWRHNDFCYNLPVPPRMPYSHVKAQTMTWKNSKSVRKVADEKSKKFYRELKQATIESGREFFATTFAYEFPFHTWRDCAFAYLPTKEQDLFPFKIIQPHDAKYVPDNKRLDCYC
ncbi:hypothetical protein ABEB36_010294 [Hypothenemus hampei]|uniref:Uncharacterized protein n=1 Tax=Hypothenemus hampei TaxID=57062 RepID=A0ABD1ENA4_HYPHA